MAKSLNIGSLSDSDDVTIAGSGAATADVTVSVPAGAEPIGGGVGVYNLTQGADSGFTPFYIGPVSGGWRARVGLGATPGDVIRVTVFASYVEN